MKNNLLSVKIDFLCFSMLFVLIACIVNIGNAQVYTEDFETGWADHTRISDNGQPSGTQWFAAPGPYIEDNIGVAGTWGIDDHANIFIWTAHPFNWNNGGTYLSVTSQMDFQTNGSGEFDDDRMGWMITNSSVNSDNIFGVQLDHPDGGIVSYWRNSGGARVQTQIVDISSTSANTWYRFWAKFTKLTATACSIDVSLTELDGSGNPTGTPYTGTVTSTSTWPGGAPDTKYFTAPTIWPAYKNFNSISGAADNAYFEIDTDGCVPVNIWSEYFPYDDGTTEGSGTPAKWTRTIPGGGDWFEVRTNRMEGRDLDGEATWTTETIDISGYTDVSLSVDLTETGVGWFDNDYIRTYYILDGGSETLFETNGDLDDFTSATASQTGLNGSNVIIVIRLDNDSDNEVYTIDNVVVQGCGTLDPTISITGTPLGHFSTAAGTPSAELSYTVSGSNLEGDITITPPTGFEISTTSGSGFGSSVVLTQSGGTVSATTIYVRFNQVALGSSSGDITHTSTNATTQNVPVRGTTYLMVTPDWTAYNDCVYDPGQALSGTDPNGQLVHYTGSNVTTFGIGSGFGGSTSGTLLNQSNGVSTGVTATLTESGGVTWQPMVGGGWTGGYDCALGTDARNTFGGVADMTGVIYYGSSGWWVDLTFTGLDAGKYYTFATSSSRANKFTNGGAGYPDRNTQYTISGVDEATNISTTGVYEISNESVWFNTGNNHDEGYVARWIYIDPGSDGTFKVRAEAYDIPTQYKAYSFDVFMLIQTDAVLPVELSSFSGSVIEEGIKLNWTTETEVNNYGFEIHRKTKDSEWQNLGFVEGHGNTNSPKSYSFIDDNFLTGKYYYRLKQIDNDGAFEYSNTVEIDLAPSEFVLYQNYPNPFNPSTTIKYSLPEAGAVKLVLYNMLGEEVKVLVSELQEAGVHKINFNANELGSGMYFYRLETSGFVDVKKMLLLK